MREALISIPSTGMGWGRGRPSGQDCACSVASTYPEKDLQYSVGHLGASPEGQVQRVPALGWGQGGCLPAGSPSGEVNFPYPVKLG